MRLKDIFEDLAVPLKLDKLPDFSDEEISGKIGTCEGYEIWGNRYNPNIDVYGILTDDLKPKALLYVEIKEQNVDGHVFQDIFKLWVDPKHRGRALSITLLTFVIRKLNTKLGSGYFLTKDGENLFKKIIDKNTFDVIYLDLDKGQELHTKPENLFNYPNKYEIILTKGIHHGLQDSRMFGHGDGILSEYCRFNDPTKLVQNWD